MSITNCEYHYWWQLPLNVYILQKRTFCLMPFFNVFAPITSYKSRLEYKNLPLKYIWYYDTETFFCFWKALSWAKYTYFLFHMRSFVSFWQIWDSAIWKVVAIGRMKTILQAPYIYNILRQYYVIAATYLTVLHFRDIHISVYRNYQLGPYTRIHRRLFSDRGAFFTQL